MIDKVLSSQELSCKNTEEIKQDILQLVENRDTEPLNQKVLLYKHELAPLFEELSLRNPFPHPEDQVSLVLGVWTPLWSTIPFQDTLPGRIRKQSYQIFLDNGYYGNIARYAPGQNLPFLQKLSSLYAYDLMVLQRFEIVNDEWRIQNVGIEQAFRMGAIPLTIGKAEDWLTKVVKSKQKVASQAAGDIKAPSLENLDESSVKRFKKAFLATPQFEHVYIERDFRIVKSRREAKQRFSYTIAVRR